MATSTARRLLRIAEELEESGLFTGGAEPFDPLLLEEVDYALRPAVHERRTASCGTILQPATDPDRWALGTRLAISRMPVPRGARHGARRFADGLSSWYLRWDGERSDEWLLFDRPAGSERDLVVLADVLGATLVQRHPSGSVRIVGSFGVLRWEALRWHPEAPLDSWLHNVTDGSGTGQAAVLRAMLEFAVHDLGALGIGALLVYRAVDDAAPAVDDAAASTPPPLRIETATHLAPLRHALAQLDGAAIFDAQGVLRELGVRLVPSADAEAEVPSLRGTRHTSALRYSFDDPRATVITVSEDGPVSVMRGGKVLGRSTLEEG